MSRFVFVSFVFLGWGFYELSGGSDFTPPKRVISVATNQVSEGRPPARSQEMAAVVAARVQKTSSDLRQKTPITPVTTQRVQADPQRRNAVALAQIISAATAIQNGPTSLGSSSGQPNLQLASLSEDLAGGLEAIAARQAEQRLTLAPSATGIDTTADLPETYEDRRTIRASRVNMRQGPGTIYPVIDRLLAGDEVVVVEDSGTGWLNLRSTKNGRIGWIAASLVSKKQP